VEFSIWVFLFFVGWTGVITTGICLAVRQKKRREAYPSTKLWLPFHDGFLWIVGLFAVVVMADSSIGQSEQFKAIVASAIILALAMGLFMGARLGALTAAKIERDHFALLAFAFSAWIGALGANSMFHVYSGF
jgi:hypothetical protein